MKIGIVCPYDITRSGGVQEHVLAQAAELRSRGHDVRILTPRPRKHLKTPAEGVIFIGNSTKVKTPLKTSFEVGISLSRDEVETILTAEDFDLLHIHEPEVPVLGGQIVAKATCPIIATFHALAPDTAAGRTVGSVLGPLARPMLSKITAMTAVSDAAARFVRDQMPNKVRIIPNGIDLKKYQFKPERPANQTILYVGRLEKRKGVRYLLKAFKLLVAQQPDAELLIAGDGEQRESLENYVKEKRIPGVTFLGFIDEEDKQRLLHEASLFCSPALYGESFGIVLLEAMASGTVTVAGANPGYESVLQGTGALSLIDPKETAEFARRLELLLTDRALREAWLEWAKDYVQQFDYERVVNQYEELYEDCLRP